MKSLMKHNYDYEGLTEQDYVICCVRNIIFKIPEEQDDLIFDYCDELNDVLINYVMNTSLENLKMIYNNSFNFKMSLKNSLFSLNFEYIN